MLVDAEARVERAELARAFNRQSVWKRFAIVIAGPLFNFAFAVLVYAGLFMYGLPEARPLLASPPQGTLAAAAGLQAGDTVRAIDGEAIATWQELRWRVLQAALQREAVKLETLDERGQPSHRPRGRRAAAARGLRRQAAGARAAGAAREPGARVRQDRRHLGVQPEDARQDADRRSVVAPSLGAGDDRRFRRPVGEPRLGLVSHFPRADQHQPRRAESAADPAARRRTPDVLCDRDRQGEAGLRALHGARTARRSCAAVSDDGFRFL